MPSSLLTRSQRHRWAFCRHDGTQIPKTQYPKKALATQYTGEDTLFTLLISWLTGSRGLLQLPSITREYHTAYCCVGKDQTSKLWFLLNAYCFHTIIKSKNCKSNHCKSGLSVYKFQIGSIPSHYFL